MMRVRLKPWETRPGYKIFDNELKRHRARGDGFVLNHARRWVMPCYFNKRCLISDRLADIQFIKIHFQWICFFFFCFYTTCVYYFGCVINWTLNKRDFNTIYYWNIIIRLVKKLKQLPILFVFIHGIRL